MRIARVVGSVVSTIKASPLQGRKLLLVAPTATDGSTLEDEPFVAVDAIGAGEGELVLIAEGSAARFSDLTNAAPVDCVIMAILDSIECGGRLAYRQN